MKIDINLILNVLTAVLALTTLVFLTALVRPRLVRRISRKLRNASLFRILFTNLPHEYTVRDILLWANDPDKAMERITKAYEWRVQQWSGFGSAILAAALAFVATVVGDYFKDGIKTDLMLTARIVFLGTAASFLAYIICQRRISMLKNQFLRLYSLLQRSAGS